MTAESAMTTDLLIDGGVDATVAHAIGDTLAKVTAAVEIHTRESIARAGNGLIVQAVRKLFASRPTLEVVLVGDAPVTKLGLGREAHGTLGSGSTYKIAYRRSSSGGRYGRSVEVHGVSVVPKFHSK